MVTRAEKKRTCVTVVLGESLKQKLSLLCVLRKEKSYAAYVRRALERMIEADLKEFPSTKLVARPQSTIYSMEGSSRQPIFTPITTTLGGERVWIIETVGFMPRAFGGSYAYMVDLTVSAGQAGCEGRAVIIKAADILGGIQ